MNAGQYTMGFTPTDWKDGTAHEISSTEWK